ncbi:MAG: PAS domain S-box protein [Nitrospirae bacterium]|nr:PAS domain S-box protein [Nitrospirota bacterium]MBF0541220.1 PAS domain S-box protein [Nitrospirota bacterium]
MNEDSEQKIVHDNSPNDQSVSIKTDLDFEHEQFKVIFNNINTMICVSEIESREIIYANDAFYKEFGKISTHICWYNVVNQTNLSCQHCDVKLLLEKERDSDKVLRRDCEIKSSKKWYVVITKHILWANNRNVRLEVIIDITYRKKTEIELRENKSLLDLAQEMTSLGFFIRTIDEDTISLSEQLYKILGYDKDKTITSVDYKARIHPDDLHNLELEVFDDAKVFDFRYRIINYKTKELRYVHLKRNIIEYSSVGKPNKILGTVQDITAQVKMEEEISKANEQFYILAEEAPSIILIFSDEGLVYINKKGTEFFGYSKEEMTSSEFNPLNILTAESIEYVHEKVSLLEEGITIEPFETQLHNKRGRVIHVLLSLSLINFNNEDARLYIITDITAQKQIESLLRKKEYQIRLLINSVAEAIYGVDFQYNCTFVNSSCLKLLGYKNEEQLIGRNMHEMIHHTKKDGKAYPIKDCEIYKAHSEGRSYHTDDEIFWRFNGTSFAIELWAYPIIENNVVIGTAVNFIDISKRKAYEEALLRSNTALRIRSTELKTASKKLEDRTIKITQSSKMAALGEMAAGLAHEINQPLTEIMLLLHNLFNFIEISDLSERREDFRLSFDLIKKSSNKIDSIIKRMRSFARQRNHKIFLIDINEIISETVSNLYHGRLKASVVTLSLNLSPAVPLINGLQFSLEQVFMMLINNAIDAVLEKENKAELSFKGAETHEKAIEITTSFNKKYNFIVIEIVDNGIGMKKEQLDRIFDPFYSTKGQGSAGISLAVCSGIISEHDGTIAFESEYMKGTKVLIKLPLDNYYGTI